MINRVTFVLCAVLLSGCGSLQNRYGPEKVAASDITAEASFVVLSTGAPEKCVSTATFLRLKEATEPYDGPDIALLSVDGYAVAPDFTTHHGYLHALKLPAGRYYLTPWIANPYYKVVKAPKSEFTINAGEVVYLGEYFMPVACSTSTTMEWRDQQQRDVALLKQKNAALAGREMKKSIAAFTGYAVKETK